MDLKSLKKGQIVWCSLNDSVEKEQQGRRPVIIIQNDLGNRFSPTTIIIPLTSSKSKVNLPVHVRIKHEELKGTNFVESTALCEQIRVVDKKRITSVTRTILSRSTMLKIESALLVSFGIGKEQKREIVWVNIPTGVGSEQRSPKPIPAVIMQNSLGNKFSPTSIIAPITAKKGKKLLPTQVQLNVEEDLEDSFEESLVLMEQIRVVDKSRIINHSNLNLNEEIKIKLEKALLISLGIILKNNKFT